MAELKEELRGYFLDKGIKIDINEAFAKYSFVLINKFSDHWFWSLDLLGAYMSEDAVIELYKYFKGIKIAHNAVYFYQYKHIFDSTTCCNVLTSLELFTSLLMLTIQIIRIKTRSSRS